jgi:hypothetical protein
MLFVRAFYVHESHFSMGSRRIAAAPRRTAELLSQTAAKL